MKSHKIAHFDISARKLSYFFMKLWTMSWKWFCES